MITVQENSEVDVQTAYYQVGYCNLKYYMNLQDKTVTLVFIWLTVWFSLLS